MAIPFPPEWGRSGREGLVVEFELADGSSWAGNFTLGLAGIDDVRTDPNGRDVLVTSRGELWRVDPVGRTGEEIGSGVMAVYPVAEYVIYDLGTALLCVGREGVVWRTRRISWDGVDEVRLEGDRLVGTAWSPIEDRSLKFSVDLRTGAAEGGSYDEPPSSERE